MTASDIPRVAVIGGGLAGLAAAVRLREAGLTIDLFEARRQLGGRASSFRDPATGELVDFCQHVSLGCCTALADFCRRTGIDDAFDRFDTLHFFSPQGTRHDLRAARWLPAPLHLAPALLRLSYLSLSERLRLALALRKLARWRGQDDDHAPMTHAWLQSQHQSRRAIKLFWEVVLVSALAESLDRISLPVAQKVFVDSFLANRAGYAMLVPREPLGELYDRRLGDHLASLGVSIHRNASVHTIRSAADSRFQLDDSSEPYSHVVLAVTWRQAPVLLAPELLAKLPKLAALEFEAGPITGIHLWFDRPLDTPPHAVLVGRLSQWLFARGVTTTPANEPAWNYQVVISASRELAGRDPAAIVAAVHCELGDVFPAARSAKVLHSRVVTEKHAVFSPLPGVALRRLAQKTSLPGLYLAGDWTATGWPATMEGAVRSGDLAAGALLADTGKSQVPLPVDLPRSFLARLLLGSEPLPTIADREIP